MSGRQTLFKWFKQQRINDLIQLKKGGAEIDNVSNDNIINKLSSRYSPNRHDDLNWVSKNESVADHPTYNNGSQILRLSIRVFTFEAAATCWAIDIYSESCQEEISKNEITDFVPRQNLSIFDYLTKNKKWKWIHWKNPLIHLLHPFIIN